MTDLLLALLSIGVGLYFLLLQIPVWRLSRNYKFEAHFLISGLHWFAIVLSFGVAAVIYIT